MTATNRSGSPRAATLTYCFETTAELIPWYSCHAEAEHIKQLTHKAVPFPIGKPVLFSTSTATDTIH